MHLQQHIQALGTAPRADSTPGRLCCVQETMLIAQVCQLTYPPNLDQLSLFPMPPVPIINGDTGIVSIASHWQEKLQGFQQHHPQELP